MHWRLAKIILLPKQEKDLRYLCAYCPISLLNRDYKILTSFLTLRLNKILKDYINLDQSGFILGRQLNDNICKL